MTVSTDANKIDHLLSRNVQREAGELRKHLEAGKPLRVKFGADPTAPDLHLGHAVAFRKLREFQELGHTVVFLVGDYTAKVGDPSGKSKTRPMLTDEEVEANTKTYLEQVGRILDLSKTEIRRNGEWFSKFDFADILRLTSQFTVARMIEREDFHKRLAAQTDVHMHELLYPMMQAYDSIALEADVEIGGTDQMFNILAGRDLQRKMGKREQDCLFIGPLLVGLDGTKKMSKSLGNYVGLTDAPNDMFGKIMSLPDEPMWDWFALTTDLPQSEIDSLRTACQSGSMNPRDAKVRLAREIITLYHSVAAADDAEQVFVNQFQKGMLPEDITEMTVEGGQRGLVDLLVESKLCESKSDARRQIEQGGVRIDGEVVKDVALTIVLGDTAVLLQKGKRGFVRISAK